MGTMLAGNVLLEFMTAANFASHSILLMFFDFNLKGGDIREIHFLSEGWVRKN